MAAGYGCASSAQPARALVSPSNESDGVPASEPGSTLDPEFKAGYDAGYRDGYDEANSDYRAGSGGGSTGSGATPPKDPTRGGQGRFGDGYRKGHGWGYSVGHSHAAGYAYDATGGEGYYGDAGGYVGSWGNVVMPAPAIPIDDHYGSGGYGSASTTSGSAGWGYGSGGHGSAGISTGSGGSAVGSAVFTGSGTP